VITFDRVVKRYGTSLAVDHLSLEIKSGETVILVGPSGCGKTTSLKMINRLIEPTEGTISIDDRDTRTYDVNELRRSIGYVIQQVGLFPHQTVADNIATVPRLLGWSKQRTRARVGELLDLIGLPAADYARRLPSELSGGERQRVGASPIIATAAMAGAFLIIIQPVEPSVGREYIGRVFAICVLGGLGSLPGTVIGAMLLGVVESITATFYGPSWAPAVSFGFLLLTLAVRPAGLLGR